MTLSIFQRTIVNASGDVQPGASVSVRDKLTNNLVQIFSDRAGTVAKPNPFTADANGFATFFVSPGEYKVTAATSSGSVTWNYVAVDGTLRTDIAATASGKGAEMVAFKQSGTGAVKRTVQQELSQRVTPEQFGAVGDGVTNDEEAFELLEADFQNKEIDLGGKKYRVNAVPTANKYTNGTFNTSPNTAFSAESSTPTLHKKAIVHKLPRYTNLHEQVIALRGYGFLYPQGFCVDESAGELFIAYDPGGGGSDSDTWVEIRDWESGALKTMFSAGGSYGEGMAVTYESGSRFLWKKHAAGVLGKYDITAQPVALNAVAPVATFSIGMGDQLGYYAGDFYISSGGTAVGTIQTRTEFAKYNSTMTLTGALSVPRSVGGFATGDPYPKRQSFAAGPGVFAAGLGSVVNIPSGSTTPLQNQGVALLDSTGAVLVSNVYDPVSFASVFQAAGMTVTRVENEGVWIDRRGTVYSLFVLRADADNSSPGGIVILEEFSKANDSLDFSVAAISSPGREIPSVYWPSRARDTAEMVNPVTGAVFSSLAEIANFMGQNNVREFAFYTSQFTGILDFAGVELPTGVICRIYSANNFTMWYELEGSHGVRRFTASGFPKTQTLVGLRVPSRTDMGKSAALIAGDGAPEGVVTASVGSIYLRLDGGASTTFYVKQSGSGNTGWVAK